MNRLAILHAQLKKVIGGRALPMLSIKGNTFTVKDGENEQNVAGLDKENNNTIFVDVHVIDCSPYMSKLYYPGKYDPDAEPAAPTCYSNDGFRPAEDVAEKQSEFCAQCPHNAWGSKTTELGKRGKACNDAWRAAVIVPEHHEEKVIMLRIPPASLQNWLAYIARFNDYDYPGQDRKMNVGDVITRIFFTPGQMGNLNFMPLSSIEPDSKEAQLMQQLVDSKETEAFIGVDNLSPEKKEEMLQLAAPSNAPKVEYHPTKMTPITKQVEEEEQSDEEEEAVQEQAKTMMAKSKATNAMLPSEQMRTKTTFKQPAQAAPAAKTSNGKPPISDDLKNKFKNLMKMT